MMGTQGLICGFASSKTSRILCEGTPITITSASSTVSFIEIDALKECVNFAFGKYLLFV